ncbi:hypothetical protein BSPWISOXPB_6465 [uncultured Gammaproteobacteria bacterium]|nr:hypothetical protein BSPWISOXPB_6465 [uncultured Gammaproteobacteria bacterium]
MQKSHGKGFVSFLGGKTIDSPIGFKTSCGCKNRRTLLNSSSGLMAVISRPKASAILVEDLPLSVSLIKSLKNFR